MSLPPSRLNSLLQRFSERKVSYRIYSLCVSQKKPQTTKLAHIYVQQHHILGTGPQLQPHVGTTYAELHNLGTSLKQR